MDYSFETNYNIVMCASSKHLIDHAHKMIKSSAGAQIKTMCVMDTKNNVFTLITFTDYIHLCFSAMFRFVERLLHRNLCTHDGLFHAIQAAKLCFSELLRV